MDISDIQSTEPDFYMIEIIGGRHTMLAQKIVTD